jgi:uncharacterized damage-inducible protein DinB
MEELLAWSDEAAIFWNEHLVANPALLALPCNIAGATTVQELVRHVWSAEMRTTQRVAKLPTTAFADMPKGPLSALFGMHATAMDTARGLLADDSQDWNETITMEYDWLPPHARILTRRKLLAHGLVHGHRHWAQLTTLLRTAGAPAEFKGDLLFSTALG